MRQKCVNCDHYLHYIKWGGVFNCIDLNDPDSRKRRFFYIDPQKANQFNKCKRFKEKEHERS